MNDDNGGLTKAFSISSLTTSPHHHLRGHLVFSSLAFLIQSFSPATHRILFFPPIPTDSPFDQRVHDLICYTLTKDLEIRPDIFQVASVAFSLAERGNPIRNLRGVEVPDVKTLGEYLSALNLYGKDDASPSVAPFPPSSGHLASLTVGSTTVKPRERPKGTSPMVGPGIVLLPGANVTSIAINAPPSLIATSKSPAQQKKDALSSEIVVFNPFPSSSTVITPPTAAENFTEKFRSNPSTISVLTPGLIAPPPSGIHATPPTATLFNDELDSFALLAASAPPLNVACNQNPATISASKIPIAKTSSTSFPVTAQNLPLASDLISLEDQNSLVSKLEDLNFDPLCDETNPTASAFSASSTNHSKSQSHESLVQRLRGPQGPTVTAPTLSVTRSQHFSSIVPNQQWQPQQQHYSSFRLPGRNVSSGVNTGCDNPFSTESKMPTTGDLLQPSSPTNARSHRRNVSDSSAMFSAKLSSSASLFDTFPQLQPPPQQQQRQQQLVKPSSSSSSNVMPSSRMTSSAQGAASQHLVASSSAQTSDNVLLGGVSVFGAVPTTDQRSTQPVKDSQILLESVVVGAMNTKAKSGGGSPDEDDFFGKEFDHIRSLEGRVESRCVS